jgi:Zn-dependent M28 family amino/carboxypeptidase
VVQSSWSQERFALAGTAQAKLALKSWISQPCAEKILEQAGHRLEELQKAASRRAFRPMALGLRVRTELQQSLRRIESPNVIGLLSGSDPEKKNEYLIYTAHYDHFGIGKAKNGDSIYNGAADNAMGVAGLLSIAEAMARAPQGARRSQVFIGIAAEEYGLLGSEYYALHPIYPAAATVATINIDGLNNIGPTRDLSIVGDGKSNLDDIVRQVAGRRGVTVQGDAFPEQGYFYRSDQFNLAKIGIPAVYLDNGLEVIGKPAGWGKQKHDEYVARDYHQPSDEIKPDWDWSGAEQLAEILFEVGWEVANQDTIPQWNPDAEFRAIREKSLQKESR